MKPLKQSFCVAALNSKGYTEIKQLALRNGVRIFTCYDELHFSIIEVNIFGDFIVFHANKVGNL